MDDILKAALEAELAQEPLFIKAWGKWVLVRELDEEGRGDFLEKSIVEMGSGKNTKRKVNFKVMNSYLAVLSTRYPSPDCLPPANHPHYAEYPGAVDSSGNYFTPPHSQAGELVFNQSHIPMLKTKGSAAKAQIADVAQRLSGLSEDAGEEIKND